MAQIEMLAAVCDAPGEGDVLNLRRVRIDDPHELEVRVKLETTGICRSDIHYLRGVWVHPKPVILGHEACGIVESVGPGVPKSRIGEKVVLTFTPSCGHCRFCVAGRMVLCEEVARAAANPKQFFCQNWPLIKTGLEILKGFAPLPVRPIIGLVIRAGDAVSDVICVPG